MPPLLDELPENDGVSLRELDYSYCEKVEWYGIKHILALRFFYGKTQMEVAAEVGISQAQVSRLEKNAINQIKKNL